MRSAFTNYILPALAGGLMACASCSGGKGLDLPDTANSGGALVSDAPARSSSANPPLDLGPDGRTLKPAQCVALPGSGYEELPLLTVGDEIPQLQGSFPNFKVNKQRTYALPGIPDGAGVWKRGNRYFVWVNHEFTSSAVSRWSDTVSGNLTGARVSLLAFDDDWACLGGTNLIRRFIDHSGVIGTVEYDGNSVVQTGSVANRLCSASLTTFFDRNDPIFLAGEETTGGRPFAIYPNGDAVVINDIPRMAFENIVPVTEYRNKTVMLALDDSADAFLVLYKGNRSGSDPNGFLSGTSYVAAVKAGGVLQANTGSLLPGTDYQVQWVEVPRSYGGGDVYDTPAIFYAWAATVATRFMRLEDCHEDPDKAGDMYFVTTGRNGTYDPYGRSWRLDLHNSNQTGDAVLRILAVGGAGGFYNPDNICIDDNGLFWIQEDPSGTQALMLGEGRRSSIFTTLLDGSSLARLFEVTQDNAGFASNPWETSGIVQVPGGKREDTLLFFDVQAHSVSDPDYVEGGQLLLGVPQRSRGKGRGHGGPGNGSACD